MPTLLELFDRGTQGRCHKWRHYLEIYERYFARHVGSACTYLEIGVRDGGSLDIMKDYLGAQARIIGIDIDPACKSQESEGKSIFIGDQADAGFLSTVIEAGGPFDMIVDDGGHVPDQQLTAFFTLFPHLKEGGIYLVEDLHATFWHGFQDSRYGINFYDFAKGLVEKLSAWNVDPRLVNRYHATPENREGSVRINNFATTQIFGIHFYDSVIVFEKRRISEPLCEIR